MIKANPIKWHSQVKVAQGFIDHELARKEITTHKSLKEEAESNKTD